MIKTVIKRDGSREPFDVDKMKRSILNAAESAGLSRESAKSAVSRVVSAVLQYTENQDEIYTESLRNLILDDLDQFVPAASEAWREYSHKTKGAL